jgi:pseudouridine synthase
MKNRNETPRKDDTIPYPVRINRYLALTGVSTRRAAEELILAGKVDINGRRAVLTDRVSENDSVVVREGKRKTYHYIAYSKKRGVLTHSPQRPGERAIADVLPIQGVFPVGRLDKDSEGLIILTDDGRITERLLSSRFDHEKEYEVVLQERVRNDMIENLEKGVVLDDGPAKPRHVVKTDRNTLSMTITEGRKHQVRRMLTAVGGTVVGLRRVRIMNIRLGNLAPGSFRHLRDDERKEFLSALGLDR